MQKINLSIDELKALNEFRHKFRTNESYGLKEVVYFIEQVLDCSECSDQITIELDHK